MIGLPSIFAFVPGTPGIRVFSASHRGFNLHSATRAAGSAPWDPPSRSRGSKILGGLRLQNDPSKEGTECHSDKNPFHVFWDSMKEAARIPRADMEIAPSQQQLAFGPLLSLPLWIGIVAIGLFMPSPETILGALGPIPEAYSAPWQLLPAAAEQSC